MAAARPRDRRWLMHGRLGRTIGTRTGQPCIEQRDKGPLVRGPLGISATIDPGEEMPGILLRDRGQWGTRKVDIALAITPASQHDYRRTTKWNVGYAFRYFNTGHVDEFPSVAVDGEIVNSLKIRRIAVAGRSKNRTAHDDLRSDVTVVTSHNGNVGIAVCSVSRGDRKLYSMPRC